MRLRQVDLSRSIFRDPKGKKVCYILGVPWILGVLDSSNI